MLMRSSGASAHPLGRFQRLRRVRSTLLGGEVEMRGSGWFSPGIAFPRGVDLALLLEGHDHSMDVHVLGGVEIAAPVKHEYESGWRGAARSSLSRGWFPAAQ